MTDLLIAIGATLVSMLVLYRFIVLCNDVRDIANTLFYLNVIFETEALIKSKFVNDPTESEEEQDDKDID